MNNLIHRLCNNLQKFKISTKFLTNFHFIQLSICLALLITCQLSISFIGEGIATSIIKSLPTYLITVYWLYMGYKYKLLKICIFYLLVSCLSIGLELYNSKGLIMFIPFIFTIRLWILGGLFLCCVDISLRTLGGIKYGCINYLTQLVLILWQLLVLIIPMAILVYNMWYAIPIDINLLRAIYQTNIHEAIEIISMHLRWYHIIPALLLCLWNIRYRPTVNYRVFSVTGILILLAIGHNIPKKVMKYSIIARNIKENVIVYQDELLRFQQTTHQRQLQNLQATRPQRGRIYIVIIGESSTRDHYGIYGYWRDTTPFLAKLQDTSKQTIIFDQVYSNHTQTVESLSMALSNLNQYESISIEQIIPLISLLNIADMRTIWLSNQTRYGISDTITTTLFANASRVVFLNEKQNKNNVPDMALLPELQQILAEIPQDGKDSIIFVHTMGNHGTYKKRVDRYFPKFTVHAPEQFGPVTRRINKIVNRYDTTIMYTDALLQKIFRMAQNYPVDLITFFSDHGEAPDHDNEHNFSKFEYTMSRIPFFIWMSQDYIQRHPQQFATLQANQHQLFTHDLFFDTLVGLLDIKTEVYRPEYDFSSKHFAKDLDFKTGHGTYRIADDPLLQNQQWLQQRPNVYLGNLSSMAKLTEAAKYHPAGLVIDVSVSNDELYPHYGLRGDYDLTLEQYLAPILNSSRTEFPTLVLQLKKLQVGDIEVVTEKLRQFLNRWRIPEDKILLVTTQKNASKIQNYRYCITPNRRQLADGVTVPCIWMEYKQYRQAGCPNGVICWINYPKPMLPKDFNDQDILSQPNLRLVIDPLSDYTRKY